jgi:metal-responsive CopG/Arc/MetJ family transcriptional regulator
MYEIYYELYVLLRRIMMLHRHTTATKKICLNIPSLLLEKIDEEAANLNITRSELTREALESYAKSVSAARLEKELKEGYIANAELAKKVCEEWKFVDAENL